MSAWPTSPNWSGADTKFVGLPMIFPARHRIDPVPIRQRQAEAKIIAGVSQLGHPVQPPLDVAAADVCLVATAFSAKALAGVGPKVIRDVPGFRRRDDSVLVKTDSDSRAPGYCHKIVGWIEIRDYIP